MPHRESALSFEVAARPTPHSPPKVLLPKLLASGSDQQV
jgi:hypothetical protein